MLIYTFDNTVVFLSPFGGFSIFLFTVLFCTGCALYLNMFYFFKKENILYIELDMNVIDSIIIIQTFSGVMAITL